MPLNAAPLPSPTTPTTTATAAPSAPARTVGSLAGLMPFLRPYRGRIAWAGVFLVLSAVTRSPNHVTM